MIGDYGSGADMQRNAITQALVNNVNPAPRTPMPAATASMGAAMSMPGQQPPGLMAQSRIAPTALGQPQQPAPAAPLPPMGSMPGQTPGLMQPLQQPLTQPVMPQATQGTGGY